MADVLVIGGTQFVGRHLVEAALEDGHRVTVFHRGKTNADLFPRAERIHGDRDGGLDALGSRRTWDVVFDTCGYVPRVVRQSAELLADRAGRYVFVSSIAVYTGSTDEDSPLEEPADPESEDVMRDYGKLKVACERVVREAFGERALLVRPGFIVGPHDTIPRLSQLLRRFALGGERLAGRRDQPVQLIDARDLAAWMLDAAAAGHGGGYNLTGRPVSMDTLLDAVAGATSSGARVTYTGDEFLQEQGVAPIEGIGYWVPESFWDMLRVDIGRALATGLRLRPLGESVEDTRDWLQHGEMRLDQFGVLLEAAQVSLEREAEILAAWHARTAG